LDCEQLTEAAPRRFRAIPEELVNRRAELARLLRKIGGPIDVNEKRQ
jgi:hypothetical protein